MIVNLSSHQRFVHNKKSLTNNMHNQYFHVMDKLLKIFVTQQQHPDNSPENNKHKQPLKEIWVLNQIEEIIFQPR